MRLLILGSLGGQLGAATKIAMDKGAKVAHANSVDQGLSELRQGHGADHRNRVFGAGPEVGGGTR